MITCMRKSRVLSRLRAGQCAFSFKLNFSCARESELVSLYGFDCIWIDMEHVPNDWNVVENHVRAAKSNDTDILVRVSKGSYSDYVRPLELDAAGIMVPHVMTAEETENVVQMTRFHPLGRRPIDGGNADAGFLKVGIADYVKQANEQRFIIVQIEDPEGVDNLNEIAAVAGIDMLFFGPGDYSHGLGVPGETDHPKVVEARKRVAEAARDNGKFAGTVGGPDNFSELQQLGYSFINIGGDVSALNNLCRTLADKVGLESA